MKALAVFQLLVGVGVLLTVWALGPFVLSPRSVTEFILMAIGLLTGPTLLVAGSAMVLFAKTAAPGRILGLVGWILSSAWLIVVLVNIVSDQQGRENKFLVKSAVVLSLVIVTSSVAAIRLYRGVHKAPRAGSSEGQGHHLPL